MEGKAERSKGRERDDPPLHEAVVAVLCALARLNCAICAKDNCWMIVLKPWSDIVRVPSTSSSDIKRLKQATANPRKGPADRSIARRCRGPQCIELPCVSLR